MSWKAECVFTMHLIHANECLNELQALMNFSRKSTDGFSIGYILLDFLGSVSNCGQMAMQSIDQSKPFLYQSETIVFSVLFNLTMM